jgi:hypothetical protein
MSVVARGKASAKAGAEVCCQKFSWIHNHFMKSTGEYFIVYMWMKEIMQSAQQLVGVSNSADETEASNAVGTVLLVACNLVVLPTAYHIVLRCSGPTLAVATSLFVNSVIDKAYILVSVFVRRTETTIGGRDFGEALLRHSLTLLPALLFIKSKDTFYELEKTYRLHSAEQLMHLKADEAKVAKQQEYKEYKAVKAVKAVKAAAQNRHSRASMRRSSLKMEMHTKMHVATNVVGVAGILIGLALGAFVEKEEVIFPEKVASNL